MNRSLLPDSSGAVRRYWDLLTAAGVMLLAGVLPWMLRGVFSDPPERPIVQPPATTVRLAKEQREAAGEGTPTAAESMAGLPPTATVPPQTAAQPAAVGVDRLVERWLVGHCRDMEESYEQRGRKQWRCSWQDLHISGSLPTVDVSFTRIDRAVGDGHGASAELLAREQVRLSCADRTCSRLAAAPGASRKVARSGAASPAKSRALQPSPSRPNAPPVVEILDAPPRVSPGERIVLEARVTDPDSSRGDEIECTWSVDRIPVSTLCWQLVWTVPVAKKYGNVIFTLIARDRRGASGSKSVSVFVGPGEQAIDQPALAKP